MNVLALDIGGANLKLAHSGGFAASWPFPLWQRCLELANALTEILASAPPADRLAVTMTGELADCFESKIDGVNAILDAVEQAAGSRRVLVYLCDGRLVRVPEARTDPLLAAASNWHVLATFAARYCPGGRGMLVDLGSTTCDIIPIEYGQAQALGRTDPERLASRELVYTGVERSPICAIVREISWRGVPCQVAQEVFATTADAYVMLGDLPEDEEDIRTADGRPRTQPFAHARLARTICADTTMFVAADAMRAAAVIRDAQLHVLHKAVESVIRNMESVPQTIVISGQGEFLLRQLFEKLNPLLPRSSLAEQLGPNISCSACAYALAVLAHERAAP